MREILFRAKDNGVLNSVWQYGSLDISYPDAPTIVRIDRHNNKMFIPILIETVGQCTGLTDKNGKKIFEGDIIKFGINQRLMYVHWNDESLTWELTDVGVPIYEVNHLLNTFELAEIQVEAAYGEVFSEIVGNIHDNPELIRT